MNASTADMWKIHDPLNERFSELVATRTIGKSAGKLTGRPMRNWIFSNYLCAQSRDPLNRIEYIPVKGKLLDTIISVGSFSKN